MNDVNLGSLVIKPVEGIDIQVQAQQETGIITQVTLVAGQSAAQVHPYAAPRSGGLWEEIRSQIRSGINSSGGLVEEVEGPFGIELHAQVRQEGAMQPVRFTALEGDRWLLRAVFLGNAARPGDASAALEAMIRQIEVVRGEQAIPSGGPLPLRLPGAPGGPGAPGDSAPQMPNPFERGPEITETR